MPKDAIPLPEELIQLAGILAGKNGDLSGIDLAQLAPIAINNKVSGLFLDRLPPHLQQHPALDAVKTDAQQWTALSLLQQHVMRQVNAQLQAEQITPLWFKGAALAHMVYDDPAHRCMGDLDCIVTPRHHEQALETLQTMGFYEAPTPLETLLKQHSHHIVLIHPQYNAVYLELHHTLLSFKANASLPPDVLNTWLNHPQEFKADQYQAFTLPHTTHLLYLCAHALLQHGEANTPLRLYLDLDHLIHHAKPDWNALVKMAVKLRWAYLTERALWQTRTLFNTPIPDEVFTALQNRRVADDLIDPVQRKQSGDTRAENYLQTLRRLSWKERFLSIIHVALPPREYMRQRYRVADGAWVWPYYLLRWWDQGRGLLRALWQRWRTR